VSFACLSDKRGCKVAMQPRRASVGQVSRQVEADLQEVVPRANGRAHTHIARKHKSTQTHERVHTHTHTQSLSHSDT
jgi:hypothetical protein